MLADSDACLSSVFPRNFSRRNLPQAVAGDGSWIVDAQGNRYLDASSSTFVAILGHSAAPVAEAIARQVGQLNFAYAGSFTSASQEALCRRLVELAPAGISHGIITTSGSTANETAIKLARQYHLLNGNADKTHVLSRRHSYHGSTLGALSLTGSQPRRAPFEPYLLDFAKVSPPDLYRCPADLSQQAFERRCADEFEDEIQRIGSQRVCAVILEPIAGAPLGALVSSASYLQRVREICTQYDVLLIIDEVVSGLGRSGDWFAIAESGITPDIITLAKGLGGGYVPIGAVLTAQTLHDAFSREGQSFVHSESFTGHVLLGTAGLAVLDFIESHDLLASVRRLSRYLRAALDPLKEHPLVGEIRGRGLLMGLEIVIDKQCKRSYPRALQMGERIAEAALKRGVIILTGNAGVDGRDGDTLMIAPPYMTSEEEVDLIVKVVADALNEVWSDIR